MPAAELDALFAALPEDRRATLMEVRDAINAARPDGLEEGLQYGMLSWFVPHTRYPAGYHCDARQPVPFASVGWRKEGLALHLFFAYVDGETLARLVTQAAARGIKLDAGKGCLRFRKGAAVPLDLIADAFRSTTVDVFLARYEAGLPPSARRRR